MLTLTIRQFLSLMLLFFLVTFDKTTGVPFLSLLMLSLIAKNWSGIARIGLLAATTIVVSALFLLPAGLTLLFLTFVVYGWIFASRAPTRANLLRVLWIGFWSLAYFFFAGAQLGVRSGAQIISWPVIFTFIVMILTWRYLEKTSYGT